jgi:hypothetical protein
MGGKKGLGRKPYLKNTEARRKPYKPGKLADHLTLSELAEHVGRDESRIRQLEKAGAIPAPARIRVGALRVRLYSKAEAAMIQERF